MRKNVISGYNYSAGPSRIIKNESNNLKWLRKESGLKLENLERNTGLSKTTLSALVNFDRKPVDTSFRNIVILADYYGVSIDYLLRREHEKQIAKTGRDKLCCET